MGAHAGDDLKKDSYAAYAPRPIVLDTISKPRVSGSGSSCVSVVFQFQRHVSQLTLVRAEWTLTI